MTLITYRSGTGKETVRLRVDLTLEEAQAADAFLRSGSEAPKDVLSLLERVRREAACVAPELLNEPTWWRGEVEA